MLKRIKTLLADKAIFIAIPITIFIAILSLIKTDNLNIPLESFSNSDKVYHAIAYFFLMLSWLYVFLKKKAFRKNAKYVILSCFIYGIIIEILQGVTTTYRTASYLDLLANGSGVVLAVIAFHVFEKKIQVI